MIKAVLIADIFIIDEHVKVTLDSITTVYIWIYLAEMAIKILGLGFNDYLDSKMNL